ncbi:MAG: 3-phosphoshikimate 1-carboxyvinyltransferase [Candidatus Omnitrophota bacterium]
MFVRGPVFLPGDKSIAHRALVLSALSKGRTLISNFPASKDCLATLGVFRKLGIKININKDKVEVLGQGLYGLKKSASPIFVGDSGTTLRLLLGVLAGQDFESKLIAGRSLSKRPMRRVTEPLRKMGATVVSSLRSTVYGQEEYSPIIITGGSLKGISYKMPVASAQVKSAILLAGLFTRETTKVIEPISTRDHTERVLKLFKANITVNKKEIKIKGGKELVSPGKVYIPGDISSASFFIVAAAILPGSLVTIKNVSLNPSRIGIVRVLKRMGANIKTTDHRPQTTDFELIGDLVVKASVLKGIVVKKEEVPSLIDELPILMVAACFAKGRTIFKGVGELRVKETDRIKSMTENLTKMGAKINVSGDDITIFGTGSLHGAKVKSFDDHRTAMSMLIAGLVAKGKVSVDNVSCIDKSFPDFVKMLNMLKKA